MEGGGGAWAELVTGEEGYSSVVLTWMGVASFVGTMLAVKERRGELGYYYDFTMSY